MIRHFLLFAISLSTLLGGLALFVPQQVLAGACTWSGAINLNWSEEGNWDGPCSGPSGIPGDGDSLTFPAEVTNRFMVNDLVGLDLVSLFFSPPIGSPPGAGLSIEGNSFTLSDSVVAGEYAYVVLLVDIILTDDVVFSSERVIMTNLSDLDLNGHQLNLDSNDIISMRGTISGNGTVVISGDGVGRVDLDNNSNTFTGDIILETDGILNLYKNNAAGNASNLIYSVGNNATVGIPVDSINIPNNLSFFGDATLTTMGVNAQFSGNIETDDSLTIETELFMVPMDPPTNLILSGIISGTGNLIKDGEGEMTLSGSASNTYTGSLTVKHGVAYLAKTVSAQAVSTNLIVGDGSGAAESAKVVLTNSNQIDAPVNVASDGWFETDGEDDTIGNLTGTGLVTVGTGTQLIINVGSSATFNGNFEGNGEFVKIGAGTFTITQDSPGFTGHISSSEGNTFINGELINATSAVNGGLLGGTGRTGTLSGGDGEIDPGATANSIGTLDFDGDVAISAIVTVKLQANSSSSYDKITATGDINLYDTPLDMTLNYVAAAGTTFEILSATGTITGTFEGLANGALFIVDGRPLIINYHTNSIELSVASVGLTNTSFKSNPTNPIAYRPFTVTSVWTATGSAPTGTAELFYGSTSLGTVTLAAMSDFSSAKATFHVDGLPAGTYFLRVEYSGDVNFSSAVSANKKMIVSNVGINPVSVVDFEEIPTVTEPPVVDNGGSSNPEPAPVDGEIVVPGRQNATNILPVIAVLITLILAGIYAINKYNRK